MYINKNDILTLMQDMVTPAALNQAQDFPLHPYSCC